MNPFGFLANSGALRAALVSLALLALSACGGGDDCCTSSFHDAAVDAPPDAGGACFPSGTCANGPACGSGCCGYGERCESGTCTCGTGPACLPGDSCVTGGPAAPHAGGCGLFCCGPASGVGCPL
jgi:hypothetical protein